MEDNDSESDGEEAEFAKIEQALKNANGEYVIIPEKRLPQTYYPYPVRKHREYIQVRDKPPTEYDSDEEWDWYESEKHDKECFFAMVNTNRRRLEVGE